jgi:hypothetical protein
VVAINTCTYMVYRVVGHIINISCFPGWLQLLSGTTNGSTSQIPLLVDDGVIGYNVAITTQPPLYTEFQPIVRLSQNLVNPNLGSSPSRDGSAGGAQASPDE